MLVDTLLAMKPLISLLFASAVPFVVVSPASAFSLQVNVSGTVYDVTTFSGSYVSDTAQFSVSSMPWYGNSSLAKAFAEAVGASLGFPNYSSSIGPLFAYDTNINPFTPYVSNWSFNASTSTALPGTPGPVSILTYATASSASPSPVPAPLPILGVAGAFAWSRRLKATSSRLRP